MPRRNASPESGPREMGVSAAKIDQQAANPILNRSDVANIRDLAETGKGELKKYYKEWTSDNLKALADKIEERLNKPKKSREEIIAAPIAAIETPKASRPTAEDMEEMVADYLENTEYFAEEKHDLYRVASGEPTRGFSGYTPEDALRLLSLIESRTRLQAAKADLESAESSTV